MTKRKSKTSLCVLKELKWNQTCIRGSQWWNGLADLSCLWTVNCLLFKEESHSQILVSLRYDHVDFEGLRVGKEKLNKSCRVSEQTTAKLMLWLITCKHFLTKVYRTIKYKRLLNSYFFKRHIKPAWFNNGFLLQIFVYLHCVILFRIHTLFYVMT